MDGQRAALGTVNVTVRAVKGRPSGSTASIRTLCSPRGRPTRIWRSALPSPGCWAADGARDACHPPHHCLRAQRPQSHAQLFHEELRLLPRREMPAIVELVVVNEFG